MEAGAAVGAGSKPALQHVRFINTGGFGTRPYIVRNHQATFTSSSIKDGLFYRGYIKI